MPFLVIGVLLLSACTIPTTTSREKVPSAPPPIDEAANVEAAIRGFYDAYNAEQMIRCTTYLTNISESQRSEIAANLMLVRRLSGEFIIREIKNIIVQDNRASAEVILTLGGETKTKSWNLIKEDWDWKLVWEESEIESSPEVGEEPELGHSRSNPMPPEKAVLTAEGLKMGLGDTIRGELAWDILYYIDESIDPPRADQECLLLRITVENIMADEPFWVTDIYFELVGSSNKIIDDRIFIWSDDDKYKPLDAELYRGGIEIGLIAFYIPKDETDLVLIWNHFARTEQDKRFFEIKARTE